MRTIVIAALLFSPLAVVAQEMPVTDDLTAAVTRMARIGHCGSHPAFRLTEKP